ncbi:MAG: adenylyltransferase/cytidyltransferase family protein, partial [bacterium]|nr:adenylyltransferase/cytidyltransferase family protein [bacterium]
MEKKTCLFIGRFQPYHIGHHMVIKGMVKMCDKVIIGIGSSERSNTEENPFTAQERKEMIQEALQNEDIIPNFDVNFIEVPDVDDDAEWTQTCIDLGKNIDTVWTG